MRKKITAGATALFVAASTLALAQSPLRQSTERPGASNWETLTDARINIVKAALQLTPDQEKSWPAVEAAIRARAKDRQTRITAAAERVRELRTGNIEPLRDRDPVDVMRRHADTLAQRAADLKKLAEAWQPLYQSLDSDQKRRMAFLTVFVLRQMGNGVEQRRLQAEQDEEEDETG
jgi:LTXXQ motif family protein